MDTGTNRSSPAPGRPVRPPRVPSQKVAEALLLGLLTAHRDGTLPHWLQRHARLRVWLGQGLLPLVRGAAGEALLEDASQASAVTWLLRWAIASQRPDHGPPDGPVAREDWLSRTSWRPFLSLQCHFGFEPVPHFRDHYHAQPGEAAASQLCGLWSVGPSTYYRYLDKARSGVATLLRTGSLDGAQRLSLRAAVARFAGARLGLTDEAAREAWHTRQAARALATGDATSALWHQARTADADSVAALLNGRLIELANAAETDAVLEQRLALPMLERARAGLLLAQAGVWRLRGDAAREQALYEQALRIAAAADDTLMLGRVCGAFGKFYEPRDADRAFAFYEDCSDALWRAGVGEASAAAEAQSAQLVDEYVVVLVRLGWLYLLRNDPRAKATLERADSLRTRHTLQLPTLAMLEQTWGEYWRRAGELPRALEHKHRALNLYERAADVQSVLKTCCNLSLVYGEVKDHERAIAYSRRVLEIAQTMAVEPELVASTRLNLGAAHFWQGDTEAATAEYEQALQVAMAAKLRLIAGRAHYNLAEVAYLRFRQRRDPADERLGDAHTAAALEVWPHESDPAYVEATRRLKGEILAEAAQRPVVDRLAPQEAVLHPAEYAQVQCQREVLAVPSAPEQHVQAHLRIAQAYLAVAMKEREAALALMGRHGLQGRFGEPLAALRATWERELTMEQQLARRWGESTGDLMGAERYRAVLNQVLHQGAINKSAYAELCGVSPATASKHLATLSQRGLLQQTGKGPSTRYVLP